MSKKKIGIYIHINIYILHIYIHINIYIYIYIFMPEKREHATLFCISDVFSSINPR